MWVIIPTIFALPDVVWSSVVIKLEPEIVPYPQILEPEIVVPHIAVPDKLLFVKASLVSLPTIVEEAEGMVCVTPTPPPA